MQYKDFIKETLKILKGIGYSVLFTYYFITIMIDRLIRKIIGK
jgi:hypothetical protein|tara:strand:- start:201 stop:329 length:129 start_codon:yes stop_codon:yes gene_type:complete